LKNIYIIRHGQTDYNLKGIIQGSRVDTDLNDTGREQASQFFEAYKHINFDKIYISKLKRTYQSVERFIVEKNVPYEAFEGLNEISWGEQDGMNTTFEMKEYYQHVANEWAKGNLDLVIGGGESPNQVMARQKPVWQYIMNQTHEKNILICMHGRALRILLCHILGLPLSQMDKFEHSNLCLYRLTYENGVLKLVENNSTAHIKNK
jgi:probable phosphoglycerate mutase